MNTLFIGPIGPFELALVVIALVLFFGAEKIPEIAESMGEAVEKFQNPDSITEQEDDEDSKNS